TGGSPAGWTVCCRPSTSRATPPRRTPTAAPRRSRRRAYCPQVRAGAVTEGTMDEQTTRWGVDEVATAVEALLGRPVGPIRPLGSGSEHAAYLLDSGLVALVPSTKAPGPDRDVGREVRLLELVAEVVAVDVPRVVAHDPASGLLVTSRVAGISMLD